MLELDAIRKDLEIATRYPTSLAPLVLSHADALLAEVERLRAESDEDASRIYELQKQVDSLQEENVALRQRANPAPARPAATVRNMAALQDEVERLKAKIELMHGWEKADHEQMWKMAVNYNDLGAKFEQLRAAIQEHKTKLLEELDLEFQQPNPVDYKLWEVIDA